MTFDKYTALVFRRHIRTVIDCYQRQLDTLVPDHVLRPLIENSLEEAKEILKLLERDVARLDS
jgi:hypothetical protein